MPISDWRKQPYFMLFNELDLRKQWQFLRVKKTGSQCLQVKDDSVQEKNPKENGSFLLPCSIHGFRVADDKQRKQAWRFRSVL